MKNIITLIFTVAVLYSCKKEVQNEIPNPVEGVFEMVFYSQNNNVLFNSKGNAFFGNNDNKTSISLDDSYFIQTSTSKPEAVYISLNLNFKPDSPTTINASGFRAYLSQGRYVNDWAYEMQTGELNITQVKQGNIRGEFTITVTSVNSPNPAWGNDITIKGKFYSRCSGYGC